MSGQPFRVGIDRDFLNDDGRLDYEIGLELLDAAPDVEYAFLAEHDAELRPPDVAPFDAILLLRSRVTAATLDGADRLVVVARFGVGYERVDVPACTAADVLLATTVDAVRQPVATGVLTLLLALSQNLLAKDRIVRDGRWEERHQELGTGLGDRTLGVVGMGNIGREVLRVCAPLGMRALVADPVVSAADAAAAGAELVPLARLLAEADFVSVNTPLNEATYHLIDRERIATMKPGARLINTSRGPVVDQVALVEALQDGRLGGAGLDVFEPEPPVPGDPLLAMDNVILSPHTISLTDDSSVNIGRSACRNILAVAAGQAPPYVVNGDALSRPAVQAKLRRLRREA